MEIVKKIEILKAELDELRPISKADELRIMQKFRLDWNYHSNNIEGNTLTYEETKALILFGLTAQGKPLKDHFEVTGHDEAIKWIIEIVKREGEVPLTETFIRQIHQLLLKEPYQVDAITPDGNPTKKLIKVGQYKTSPNHVKTKTGEIFRFATPEETPARMSDLLKWYREKQEHEKTNPIVLAAEFHYRFIRIHPFDDGNGRTARILMNLILMQYNYPPVIIKTEDKENYFAVLRQADAGSIQPFINYVATNLEASLDLMLRGLKGESIEEPDDIYKEIALLEKRLENVSNSLIAKNKEVLINLYDSSIVKLIREYVEKSQLFDKFYVKNDFTIGVNNHYTHTEESLDDLLKSIRQGMYYGTSTMTFKYQYHAFNRSGFNEFNYLSEIKIFFDELTYRIQLGDNNQDIIKKVYNDSLTKEEITKIVGTEIKKHKEYIEEQLSKIK